MPKPALLRFLVPPLVLLLGFGIGWISRPLAAPPAAPSGQSSCLRLPGYKLVSPLLLCNAAGIGDDTADLPKVRAALQAAVDQAKRSGAVTQASVYFRDLTTGREASINGAETFYPASMKKVPMMMRYYKEAEADPSILTAPRVLTGSTDYNAGAGVPPAQAPQYGQSYTSEQLIGYMIKYSDNISYEVLLNQLGPEKFKQIYDDLQLHYKDAIVAVDDYVTPYQFSLFFRTLYNATYLSADDSEKALDLLSQADFKDGLVAGVPAGTTVAHKFGVGAVTQSGGGQLGELHDCGIVYADSPYLVCVMTKSQSPDIAKVEAAIADISRAAYGAR